MAYGNNDKPFNASDYFLQSIITTLEQTRDCLKVGDFVGAHQLLKYLVDVSTFEWTDEEVTNIDEILKKVENMLNQPDAVQLRLKVPAVSLKVSEGLRMFMKGLQKRQRIFYTQEFKTFEEEIAEGFS